MPPLVCPQPGRLGPAPGPAHLPERHLTAHTGDIAARLRRNRAPSTLLKLLSRLEKRGVVRCEKTDGRIHAYTPLVGQEDCLCFGSHAFLHRLHEGSLSSLVAALFPDRHLNQTCRKALEDILNQEET